MRTPEELVKKMRGVNALLKKKGREIRMAGIKARLATLKYTNPTAYYELANAAFVEIIRRKLEANDLKPIDLLQARKDASFELGLSIEGIKRYFETHTATRAELRMFGKQVYLNPDYSPLENQAYLETEDEAKDEGTGDPG